MALYDIQCPMCGVQEVYESIHTVGKYINCPICTRPRPRIITFNFHHVEDRTHLWKGPMGNGWSTALGEYMPQSRTERDALAKKKGVEFCSLDELRADNKEAAEALDYKAHVEAGGARDERPAAPSTAWQTTPSWAKDLV